MAQEEEEQKLQEENVITNRPVAKDFQENPEFIQRMRAQEEREKAQAERRQQVQDSYMRFVNS